MAPKQPVSSRSARTHHATTAATAAAPFYSGRTYAVDDSYGYLLRRLYASIQRHVEKRMQPLDLTAMQWGPLMLLAEGKGHTAAELARAMDIDTGAMTRMLDRLEAKGLLGRARSVSDRRLVHLELTAEGLRAAAQIPQVLADVLNLHLRDFDQAELQLLMTFLRRMITNGGRHPTDSGSVA